KDRRSPQFAAQIGSPGARLRGVPEGTSLTRWRAPSLGNSHQAQEVQMGIQVTLYQALRSVKVPAGDAEKVVEDLESHIAMKITEANKELVGELKSQRWVLGFLLIVTTISASLGGYVAFILK
ncbi:hypothetical protein, partial [Erythrobacter donghaensis]|uniref:hypothetical protein n=1 Tax=Erythrobacter donghaensis TaxID=267135 RepID=UPI001E3654AB